MPKYNWRQITILI